MASVSALGAGQADQDTFLKLLVAQVQNQNPLDPVSDTEFIAQLAQFNTLSSLEQLNASFDQMLKLTQLTQGSELIGKTVQYFDANGDLRTGDVGRVLSDGSQILLEVNGDRVTLDQIAAVLP
jgi:flagellar basal-body rod modification protein FlgD